MAASSRSPTGVLRFEYTLASEDTSLAAHLLDVARRCNRALLQQSRSARRITVCAALTHDVGKAAVEQQRAIRQQQQPNTEQAAHCSALWCWWLSRTLPRWERVAATVAVLAHHGLPARPPQRQLQALVAGAENHTALRAQLKAMDVDGVGLFLLDAGSRLMLQVPASAPGRQLVLDALIEDRQVSMAGRLDEVRVEDYLAEHGDLLASAHS